MYLSIFSLKFKYVAKRDKRHSNMFQADSSLSVIIWLEVVNEFIPSLTKYE